VYLVQSPGRPYQPDNAGRQSKGRLVLVRHSATEGSENQVLLGSRDEALSGLGTVHASKTAEFLLDMKVRRIATLKP
jgi:broad specificity phosphatase PhoE